LTQFLNFILERIIDNNNKTPNTSARGRPKNNSSTFSTNMSNLIPMPSPSKYVAAVIQEKIEGIPLSDSKRLF